MILITGATGNIGGATLEVLVAGGRQVRALSRSERSWPDGVEGVVGDSTTRTAWSGRPTASRPCSCSAATAEPSGCWPR